MNLKNAVENQFTAKTPRAQRTCSKDNAHLFGEDTNQTIFIQNLDFPLRLRVFAVEVLFQLRFLG